METPLPIPNRAVKHRSADGTWGATPWESRSPPVFSLKGHPRGWPFLLHHYPGAAPILWGGPTQEPEVSPQKDYGQFASNLLVALLAEAQIDARAPESGRKVGVSRGAFGIGPSPGTARRGGDGAGCRDVREGRYGNPAVGESRDRNPLPSCAAALGRRESRFRVFEPVLAQGGEIDDQVQSIGGLC